MNDLLRLGVISEEEMMQGAPFVLRKLTESKILSGGSASDGTFILAQKPDRSCIYLNEMNQCSVYPVRPRVCREFPHKLGERPGYCPHETINEA